MAIFGGNKSLITYNVQSPYWLTTVKTSALGCFSDGCESVVPH